MSSKWTNWREPSKNLPSCSTEEVEDEFVSTKFNKHKKKILSDSEDEDAQEYIKDDDEDVDDADREGSDEDITALSKENYENDDNDVTKKPRENISNNSAEESNDEVPLPDSFIQDTEDSKDTKDTDLTAPPEGLIGEFEEHQRSALSWLIWRETQKPPGGILADDMGLGKTLTMISLILKSRELDRNDNDGKTRRSSNKDKGGTLVVCPASVLYQWSEELVQRTEDGLLSFNLHHGPKRETNAKTLAEYDVVFTTYNLVSGEFEKKGPLFNVEWLRIIIDEAHEIRNYKSKTSNAVCELHSKFRWAVTGTPINNKESDMYALLKFLRYSPFDDLTVWERSIGDKSEGGYERLRTEIIPSIMLRRTKEELSNMKPLKCEIFEFPLDAEEHEIYNKIHSKTFAQFLSQQAEKLGLVRDLRLRQICNHPSLIINMLNELQNLSISDDQNRNDSREDINRGSKEAASQTEPMSSKMKKLFKLLKLLNKDDKAVIVSQWPSFLHLIGRHLKDPEVNIPFCQLDGKVPVAERQDIIDQINDPKGSTKILLLSLKAGYVGLNLMGANHLFIMEPHWNPQMEIQAVARVYRLGQKKPVFIYKLIAKKTIEKKILDTQKEKIDIADSMFIKISQVLKQLFQM
ncbi:unnamed protein product [Phyllotreta striolata]|uniref:Uncharacterized protein n=1 Tax=Phyllotreta striolata TaxID=444603 RepID=A0A9N9XND2_PHYSR|nr:unnamed protein product [Phyllotreta striolata]